MQLTWWSGSLVGFRGRGGREVGCRRACRFGRGHSSGMPQLPEAFRRRLVWASTGLAPCDLSHLINSRPVMGLSRPVILGSGGSFSRLLVLQIVTDIAFIRPLLTAWRVKTAAPTIMRGPVSASSSDCLSPACPFPRPRQWPPPWRRPLWFSCASGRCGRSSNSCCSDSSSRRCGWRWSG